jgi:hypothetical protein
MTDPTILDLRRELEKARVTLIDAQTHLAHHAEANAALHCATTVLYSPLHAKVTASIQQIEHALQRTEKATTAPAADADADARRWAAIALDIDRCEHGRHAPDDCFGCGGQSQGNPILRPGHAIGYGLRDVIVVPEWADRHDPKAWRRKPTEEPRP